MCKEFSLKQMICLPLCAYYKPDKNEELTCKGYQVVKQLQQQGRTLAGEAPGAAADHATREMLVQKMCMTCDFHEQDCDFMIDRAAKPCGGFILLVQLLAAQHISLADIELLPNSGR